MAKNKNRKSCPLVSLMTGVYYGLFVDIVTYLPDDLKTFNPFKDDLLQIRILFNYPCSWVSNRFVKPLLKINTQLLGDELINEV